MFGSGDDRRGDAPTVRARRRGRRGRSAGLLAAALLLTGCTGGLPTPNGDDPERAATELAAGLTKKDLKPVEFVAAASADVDASFQTLVRGMGPVTPAVSVSEVDRSGSAATATLDVSWTFPGVPQKWTYTTTAQLQNDAGRWKTAWQASIVEPQLNGSNRLSQRRVAADRGEVLGEDDDVIVEAPAGGADRDRQDRGRRRRGHRRGDEAREAGRHRRGRRTPRRSPPPATTPSSRRSPTARPTTPDRPTPRCSRSRARCRSRASRCWRRPATSPGRSSAPSDRRPRRSSTTPTAPSWPATRWACPGCRSGTTAPSAARRGSRCGCCR